MKYADVQDGGTLAVFGLGPVGQFASRIGTHLGLRVVGMDPVPERREMAARQGVEVLDYSKGVADELREMTGGRGPDGIVDAVGMEALYEKFQKKEDGCIKVVLQPQGATVTRTSAAGSGKVAGGRLVLPPVVACDV